MSETTDQAKLSKKEQKQLARTEAAKARKEKRQAKKERNELRKNKLKELSVQQSGREFAGSIGYRTPFFLIDHQIVEELKDSIVELRITSRSYLQGTTEVPVKDKSLFLHLYKIHLKRYIDTVYPKIR